MKDFLEKINKKGVIEYCKINSNGCIVITEKEAFENKQDNIYFLGGGTGNKRSKDSDIKYVSYLRFDLDIFNNIKELYGYEATQEDLNEAIETLKEILKGTYFSDWSYIVKSGKGIHLYFCGDAVKFDSKVFSLGMKRLYRYFNNLFLNDNPYLKPDDACCNISRIMRLPGSINQKNKEECKIVYRQDKIFNIEIIKGFAEKERLELEEKKKIKQKELEEQLKKYGKEGNELYNQINLIPSYQIAQMLLPQFPLDKNGKNFKNEKQGFTGYFYNKETNTICNGGSRYFNWGNSESCFNNFSLVKNFKNWTDREVFLFFKQLLGMK